MIGLLTILLGGCELTTDGGLHPGAPSALASLFVGQWSSSSSAPFATPESCTDLEWSIMQDDASTFSGNFSATCSGGVEVEGTLTGILVDEVLEIDGSGTATAPGSTGCAFTLTGTARVVEDTIQLDYTGSTCVGPVSGTEILVQL